MEKYIPLFEQYGITPEKIFRGRKMILCQCKNKLYALSEPVTSVGKINREFVLKQYLKKQGYLLVDQYVKTEEEEPGYEVYDKYQTPYVLREYFQGKECDIYDEHQIYEASKNLALLHKASFGAEELFESRDEKLCAKRQFVKRNKEMKRARAYMQKMIHKSEFELTYNKNYDVFEEEAHNACCQLEMMEQQGISKEQTRRYGMVHGAYQHHNILFTSAGIATVNFEGFGFGNQLLDLYCFLRKALEKNNYRYSVAKEVVSGYDSVLPLQLNDYKYLYIMLLYPEKFWKISNHYVNSKKTWVPPKNVEKLKNVIRQNEEKRKFLMRFKKEFLE